jgi:hypothetical protein
MNLQPPPLAPPFALLHPRLTQAFLECFVEGHSKPAARPQALAWVRLLDEVAQTVIRCASNPQHVFWPHLKACPWCDRKAGLGGRDPFPTLTVPAPPLAPEMPAASQPATESREPRQDEDKPNTLWVCEECGTKSRVPLGAFGKLARCPYCDQVTKVGSSRCRVGDFRGQNSIGAPVYGVERSF